MKAKLEIRLDNDEAAFNEPWELAKYLRAVASRVEADGEAYADWHIGCDGNGNTRENWTRLGV